MDKSGPSLSTFKVCGVQFTIPSRYKLVKPLGHGAYGVVCAAVDDKGRKVAIKKIPKAFKHDTEAKRTLRELKILCSFDHENILKIVDILRPPSFEEFEDVYIVTELMDSDLHQIIQSGQQLSPGHIRYFLYQILRGLKYIHSAHVLHRDLKPSNLLLNSNCDLKICDFGLARVADPRDTMAPILTEYVATRWYRAPEIMLSWTDYAKAIDIWSVGCIFAEILGGKPLFRGRDYMHQLHLIIQILGSPSPEDTEFIVSAKAKAYVRNLKPMPGVPFKTLFPKADPLGIDLLSKMLQFSPRKRITVANALKHPYFSKLHEPEDEPVAGFKFNFSFEKRGLKIEALKGLLWQEICRFHGDKKTGLSGVQSEVATDGKARQSRSTVAGAGSAQAMVVADDDEEDDQGRMESPAIRQGASTMLVDRGGGVNDIDNAMDI